MTARAPKGIIVNSGTANGKAHGNKSGEEPLTFMPEGNLAGKPSNLDRTYSGVPLSARDRSFWDAHSGIRGTPADVERGLAMNATLRTQVAVSSLTLADVAEILRLSTSTVRRYGAKRKLYSTRVNGRPVFPRWQFTRAADALLPGLEAVLSALPEDLDPGTVGGFFLTPQPDLSTRGDAVSVAVWLEEGGELEPVLAMADALSSGY